MRIATRASALARWQAESVARGLAARGIEAEMVLVSTEGDRRLDVPLAQIGGKGVFVKEVQAAVLAGDAEVAVHSAKDLPARTPEGLVIAAALERADPRDVLVGSTLASLRPGAVVATGAPRRRAQLAALRPDLEFAELRGNIDTRLSRATEFDAIVMAAAALERLGRAPGVVDPLAIDMMVPQVGQGVVVAECRADDAVTLGALSELDHARSRVELTAERAFLDRLGGDCDLPAGAHARLVDGADGLVVNIFGVLSRSGGLARAELTGSDPRATGIALAEHLLGDP